MQDIRMIIALLLAWLAVLFVCFVGAGGGADNGLLRFGFGPSAGLAFLGAPIDTWRRWATLMLFAATDTAINTYASEVVGPWITNTVYDHKESRLEYSQASALAVTNLFFLYHNLRSIFTVYLAFTQIDVVFVRIAVDVSVTLMTSWQYIRAKTPKAVPGPAATSAETSPLVEITIQA